MVSRSTVLIAVGLIIFILYLYFFVPFREVLDAVEKVNPFYFSLTFVALFLSTVFYSLAWQQILRLLSVKTQFLKTFQFIWAENFMDVAVPARPVVGDICRIFLMQKECGENAGKITASVIGHRILSTVVTIGGLVTCTVIFAVLYGPSLPVLEFVSVIAAGGAFFTGLLIYFGTRKAKTEKLIDWLISLPRRLTRGRWTFDRFREAVINSVSTFQEGLVILGGNPKGLINPLIFSILAWIADIFIALFVFVSLGTAGTAAISLGGIVVVYSISVALQYIPIGVIPGEIGLVEIVMTTLFVLIGSPQAIGVFAVATILIRGLTLWLRMFVGALVIQSLGIKSILPSVESTKEKAEI